MIFVFSFETGELKWEHKRDISHFCLCGKDKETMVVFQKNEVSLYNAKDYSHITTLPYPEQWVNQFTISKREDNKPPFGNHVLLFLKLGSRMAE